MSKLQALLLGDGKHTAADAVARAQAVLSEADLLRATFDVGYFPADPQPVKSR